MRKIALAILFALALSLPDALALLPGTDRCPPYVGTFHVVASGLVVTIVKDGGVAVSPRSELVANPLSDAETERLVQRGNVEFHAHRDGKSDRLFVHWESLHSIR